MLRFKTKRAHSILMTLCIFVLLVLTLSARSVLAIDPTPCDPCRWTNDAWSAETSFNVSLSAICRATIYYKTRQCLNDGCHEVKIDRIEYADTCNMSAVKENALFTRLGDVFYDFINGNPMAFPPVTEGSSSCWRFITPRCWRYAEEPCTGDPSYSNPDHVMLGCDDDDCCVSQVVVTKDACQKLRLYEYPFDQDMASLSGFSDMYDETKPCENQCPQYEVYGVLTSVSCFNFCGKSLYEGLVEFWK